MSEKTLRTAAKLRVPQQMPDMETKLMMMLMADRADDNGLFTAFDDVLVSELTQEVNAAMARLRGDQFVRAGIDNARINRVLGVLQEAQDS